MSQRFLTGDGPVPRIAERGSTVYFLSGSARTQRRRLPADTVLSGRVRRIHRNYVRVQLKSGRVVRLDRDTVYRKPIVKRVVVEE